ncbi:MAG: hypothetical protein AB2L18_02190 [Anaerolineaceae bacterium]
MKKTIIIILLIALFAFSGYTLLTKFDVIKARYLASRVDQLLTEMPTALTTVQEETETEVESTEVTETSSVSAAIATAAAEATAQAEEAALTEAVTEAPTAEPTVTPTSAPTPTPTIASNDPGIYLGAADWTDSMDDIKNWPVDKNDYSSATHENGYYRITSLAEADGWRLANTDGFANGYVELVFTTETCSVDDHYGIIFRVPVLQEANRGYLFGVTCDGRYNLRLWDGTTGDQGLMTTLIRWKSSAMLNTGSNKQNVLGVMTKGNVISLYINGELVDQITDDNLTGGYFGAFVGWEQTENFSVRVEKASYWMDAE